MSEAAPRNDIVKRTVVLQIPGMDTVTVQRDVAYQATEAGALTMDLYAPPESKDGARRPAVVIVSGYPDRAIEAMLGCKPKDVGHAVSWGRLLAASGLTAVTYTNRAPTADLHALLQHLRQDAASLGIDQDRIGLLAFSGNVPVALSALMQGSSGPARCAALCYGFMLDGEGETHVAAAAAQFGFENPCAGRSIDDLPRERPLFLVRAGQDQMPHLNETIDRFVADALARNQAVTLVNHAAAPHAFDLLDDSEMSREVIRRIVGFLRFHLLA